MKLELNKKEYQKLLEFLSIFNTMLSLLGPESFPLVEEHYKVSQKILSRAKDFGCKNLVEYDHETADFYFSDELFSEEIELFLDRFQDLSFWAELMNRLSLRDIEKEIGGDEFASKSREEKVKLTAKYLALYTREFAEHGVQRLRIKRDAGDILRI
jgi:hypothetical protein